MNLDTQIKKTYSDGFTLVMRDKFFKREALQKIEILNDNEQGIVYEVVDIEGNNNE